MKIRRIGFVLAALLMVLLAALLVASQKNDQAEVQLKAAMHRELVDGDLKGAIEQYQKILASFGSNRTVAAKALVQMGQCYEKLGKTEARNAYERVVREFADQPESARLARQRLAALAQPTVSTGRPEITVRRVWTNRSTVASFASAPSPDGRYLPYYDGETGDVAIHDFTTGQSRRLNLKKGDWTTSDEEATDPLLSPDGKRIAYCWLNKDQFTELRVVGVDGSEPRVLYNKKEELPSPQAWSPDGARIICTVRKKDDTGQIVLISVADASMRTLKTLEKDSPRKLDFSPDGRFVAYDLPPKGTSGQRDIFVLEIETGRETPVVEHTADDRLLGWTPDGTRMLFSSDRAGRKDAWLIQVSGGKPQGMPELIKKDLGSVAPLGFTRTGAYYYHIPGFSREIYATALDLASGKLLEPLRPVPRGFVGWNCAPDWSADGKFLAFTSRRLQGEQLIVIQSAQSGEERELKPKLKDMTMMSGLRWAPDARSLLVDVRDSKKKWGLLQVDVQTGDVTQLVQFSQGGMFGFGYMPNGKTVFYTVWDDAKHHHVLTLRDLETGRETELTRSYIRFPTLSPDGKWMAFASYSEPTRSVVLNLLPAAGGGLRELHSFEADGPRGIAWTPDGRELICGFSKNRKTELWRVPTAGGEPQRLDVVVDGLWQFSLHPDGHRIVFEAWENKEEVWVMENFLPPQEARKTQMAVRRVWGGDIRGAPTRDGRYLTFMDGSENLAVYDIATGQKRLLTNKDPRSLEFVMLSVPSPDGKEVAYGWYNKDNVYDLRIVGMDGAGPRVVYTGNGFEVEPIDWSPNGKNILALFYRKDKGTQMVLVSVTDGSVRELKTFDRGSPGRARFSPDGRYIAYDFPQRYGSNEHDIFLLAAEGGREIPLVQHPANDLIFDWTPDGKRVLFGSDRSGTMGAWCIQIAEGKPVGTPALVKADLGRGVRPMGFAQNGSYYYGVFTQMSDVYIAELDLATGKLLAEPILATQRLTGSNSRPEWSDDGRQLLFLSTREPGVWGAKAFCIRSTETGEVHELASKLNRVPWVRWSPDGRSLIGPASIDNAFPYCRIDVQSGEFERVDLQKEALGLAPAWSRDSKAIFYHQWNSATKAASIVFRDLATGQEKVLHSVPDPSIYYAGAALSRDGKHLAFVVTESESGSRVLKVMPAAGGEARELLREDRPLMARPVLWLPDSQNLLFIRWAGAADSKTGLWLISAQGGEPRKLDLPESFRISAVAAGMRELSIHPDGRHIAYTAGRNISEVWVMENFLQGK